MLPAFEVILIIPFQLRWSDQRADMVPQQLRASMLLTSLNLNVHYDPRPKLPSEV